MRLELPSEAHPLTKMNCVLVGAASFVGIVSDAQFSLLSEEDCETRDASSGSDFAVAQTSTAASVAVVGSFY